MQINVFEDCRRLLTTFFVMHLTAEKLLPRKSPENLWPMRNKYPAIRVPQLPTKYKRDQELQHPQEARSGTPSVRTPNPLNHYWKQKTRFLPF